MIWGHSFFRISLQHETSSVRDGSLSGTDDYYKFATYIKSNGVSTSEARLTPPSNNSQRNVQEVNPPHRTQSSHPLTTKGEVTFCQT